MAEVGKLFPNPTEIKSLNILHFVLSTQHTHFHPTRKPPVCEGFGWGGDFWSPCGLNNPPRALYNIGSQCCVIITSATAINAFPALRRERREYERRKKEGDAVMAVICPQKMCPDD
ncbi:hypothetical protein ACTXT7_014521 [Hymenolepis weldensis]